MKLNSDILKNMLRAIIGTRDQEIGCDDCFDQLDKFIEMKLAGKSPEQAMPLVQTIFKDVKIAARNMKPCLKLFKTIKESSFLHCLIVIFKI